MHFDLIDLKLFANIAEANSLTRGAESSHISPPAASMRIKNLEENVGTKLLYRTNQGVTLTPSGQAFLHHARAVLQQLDHLRGDLQEYAQGVKGHVRIFANTTAMTEFIPDVLRSYLATHPDINVDLRERLSHDIVRAVSDGSADIGVVAGNVRMEGLEILPCRQDRLVLAVAGGHPLAQTTSIDFSDTLNADYIGLHESSAIHSFLKLAADKLNKPLKIRIQVGNFEAVCRMIEANIGIGVLPESAAVRYARTMDIRIIRLNDDWAARNLQICVRSLRFLPSFVQELVGILAADTQMSSS